MGMSLTDAIEYVESHYTFWSESISPAREAIEKLIEAAKKLESFDIEEMEDIERVAAG